MKIIKKRIAVIGSASASISKLQQDLAFNVGRCIIDSGCRLLNGGMGGTMEYSAIGAQSSEFHHDGDIIGVLPGYDASDANPFIDTPLPTGLGVARNAVLMASCDAVIALDGGSGTLSEIALGWQMQKPVACLGEDGWHKRITDLTLDHRRDDSIQVLRNMEEVRDFLDSLHSRERSKYTGVQKSSKKSCLSIDDAKTYLDEHFHDDSGDTAYELLGNGSEAFVLSDRNFVYKVFYPSDYTMLMYANLKALAVDLSNEAGKDLPFPPFEVFKDELLVVRYPYFESTVFDSRESNMLISFLKKLKALGWCLSNIKSENFRVNIEGELIFIDIGRDILSFDELIFISTCKRAFITWLFDDHPKVKDFCRYTNNNDDFVMIAEDSSVTQSQHELLEKYTEFYRAVCYDT